MAQIIAQRYEISGELGAGGMGTVFKGRDIQSQQTVAIKQLKPEVSTPELIERFVREGVALRDLNHPNIVKMLDEVEEAGHHYLIIEYLPGGDLSDLLKAGRLPVSKVLQLAIDICDALTRAHRLDIIHRDLKPANVLLADDGTPRLTDFGIAHIGNQERVTGTGAVVGTLDYLAPETLNGEAIDPRADIWAFGVMLFEMLAGKRPFVGDTLSSIIAAILYNPVPDLEDLSPDAPIVLVDLIYRMLEKDPQARISSVRHVGAALEDILQGRETTSPLLLDARFDTPIPDAATRPKHNLPLQTTAFVGREVEIAELTRLLDQPDSRLVTILGPGGMGKTRLALEVAANYAEIEGQYETSSSRKMRFPDGVYFVELAPLSDPANIVTAIGEATQYQFQEDERDPQKQLLDYLREKQMLLLLDNHEHLMAGTGRVTDILQGTAHIKIIVTSRQKLNQTGEVVYNLEGMDFPQWETPEDALEYAAVKLFMQSARRARPDFELTPEDLPSVARISQHVSGMPLGILLAASWLSMLSPHEIADEIQQGMDFLESDIDDLPERQRSIRAVFDYSWNLMNEAERSVFAKLSIFKGGFTREAAQQIANANLRTLMTLMNKSLIRRDTDSGRYEVHELLRQFGQEQLTNSGFEGETLKAHSAHYAALLSKLESNLKGNGQIAAIATIGLDFENIRLAWATAIQQQDGAAINQMLEALHWYCTFRSRFREGIEIFQQARQQFPANSEVSDLVAGRLSNRFPEPVDDPLSIFERALAIAKHHNDTLEIAWCTRLIGHHLSHGYIDPQKGNRLMEESLTAFQTLGDDFMAAIVLDDLSWGYVVAGDQSKRRLYVQQSVALRQKIGDEFGAANVLRNLGVIHMNDGDFVGAEQAWLESSRIANLLGDIANLVWCKLLLVILYARSTVPYLTPDNPLLAEAEVLAEDIGLRKMILLIQGQRSLLTALNGGYEEAMQIIQQNYPEKLSDYTMTYLSEWAYSIIGAGLKEFHHIRRAIRNFSKLGQEPHSYASICLPGIICLIASEGQYEYAAEMSGLLTTLSDTAHWSDAWSPLLEVQADLQKQLGTENYNAAFERGKLLDFEIVVPALVDEFGEDA